MSAHPRPIRQLRPDEGEERRPGVRIDWRCDGCGALIGDGDGSISVELGTALTAERARRELDAGLGPVDMMKVLALPAKARWHAWHHRCDPDLNGGVYRIGVEKIRTVADLLSLWLHLSTKRWFPSTNWAALISGHVLPQLDDDDGGAP